MLNCISFSNWIIVEQEPPNYGMAVKLLAEASRHGHILASYHLGLIYYEGNIVPASCMTSVAVIDSTLSLSLDFCSYSKLLPRKGITVIHSYCKDSKPQVKCIMILHFCCI
jgi:TPR repeat protein